MRTTPVSRRLHRAFLLALVASAAACGGKASGSSGNACSQTSSTDRGMLPASNACQYYVYPPCGYDGGSISTQGCAAICPPTSDAGTLFNCLAYPENGVDVVQCSYCPAPGRRSEGQAEPPAVGDSPGSFFAYCSSLEHASVHAFRRLARELEAHGAMASLVARARRAAVEESSHARTTRQLARRFGGSPVQTRARRLPVRALAAVALENAVEGCVRETYGALVAKWQARSAQDPQVRRALRTIARDEARHADIAWSVAAWAESRLTAAERRAVREARRRAVEELRCQIASDPPRALVEQAGLPRAADARRLLDTALREGVFPRFAA